VAFLDGVGITRATLVGHSASGFIARRVAETHPDRVARLVLINCAVTLPTQVRREMQAAVQGLQDPLPVAFVRELHVDQGENPGLAARWCSQRPQWSERPHTAQAASAPV
jgi:pimeloyl-ACP methyl ester carboxylesterase